MSISFPENLTAGQLEPIAELIQPYENFPKKITGPTVWQVEEFRSRPDRWQRKWTPELIAQLEAAFDKFEASGKTLPEINRETFPLPSQVAEFLSAIREEIVNGQGFILIEGLPVTEWPVFKSAAIYLAIGTIFGVTLSQNARSHILGHVKVFPTLLEVPRTLIFILLQDLGNDPTQIHKVRIYSTSARQYFHCDAADIVGLLCLHKALEGGESDVVSAHNLWNTLQAERPDVAELLAKPNWYFDRKGEVSEGQKPWVQRAVFYFHDGRVLSHFDPYFVKSISRHVEAGLIPGHSKAQLEAIEVLEQTAQRLSLHMVLKVGDIQFVADTHVLHARTAYKDHLPPAPRRHLLRLWLATPESQGGWKRPFPDSAYTKRGGIQVNDQAETCPLDAE